MKRLLALVGCAVFLLALAGCQPANSGGNGRFPAFLVGVWQVEEGQYQKRWAFKFERDGSISKIIHAAAGPVDLAEGSLYMEGPDPNTYAAFVMGPCPARYDAKTRQLSVDIILDYYVMKLPQGELEGKSKDYFVGPVSKDGKTWNVEWRSYGWLEGAEPPDFDLIRDNPNLLVFTKLDLSELAGDQ